MSLFIFLTDSNSAFQQVYLPAIEGYVPDEMVKSFLTSVTSFSVT